MSKIIIAAVVAGLAVVGGAIGHPYATYDSNGNQLTGGGRTNVCDSQNRPVSCTYGSNTSTFTCGNFSIQA